MKLVFLILVTVFMSCSSSIEGCIYMPSGIEENIYSTCGEDEELPVKPEVEVLIMTVEEKSLHGGLVKDAILKDIRTGQLYLCDNLELLLGASGPMWVFNNSKWREALEFPAGKRLYKVELTKSGEMYSIDEISGYEINRNDY